MLHVVGLFASCAHWLYYSMALMWFRAVQALIKFLEGTSDEDIPGLHVPIGTPLVYELDENLSAVKHYKVADHSKLQE